MEASARSSSRPSSLKATILLVDDEPMVLKMLQTFLSSQNYRTICASSGQQAIIIIEQQHDKIDLLITDIRMPDMHGIQLLEAVHQLLPDLPTLLITGYSDFELVAQGLKQRAFDLLFKPIDFDQLTWSISRARAFSMTQRIEREYKSRLEDQVAQQTKLLCAQLEELQEAQRKANEVDELKREFLSLISHEFRTPLHGIMGALQLLEEQEAPGKQNEFIAMLKRSTQRLSSLVNDLLTLAEARSAKHSAGVLSNTPYQAAEALDSRYRSRADSSGITLTKNCTDQPDLVLSGPWDALHIAAGCLLDNAFKFTDRGGQISYRIWTEPAVGSSKAVTVMVQVTDNGCGIPLAHQEVIFQPFTQMEHYLTRRKDGSGVGLAIVRSICDKLGGSLTLESSPDKGSCFTCGLPFTKTEEVEP